MTSAPAVADFVPPEPTATDPYPGYYQLPSGQWAAYDPAYYAKFFPATDSATDTLRTEHQAKQARLGNWKELDDGRAAVTEFDVGATIARTREEQAKIPQAAKPAYTETYNATGQHKGLANERHQLTSLLHSAFSQREELEERIRQNKKSKQNTQRQYGELSPWIRSTDNRRFLESAVQTIVYHHSSHFYSCTRSSSLVNA